MVLAFLAAVLVVIGCFGVIVAFLRGAHRLDEDER